MHRRSMGLASIAALTVGMFVALLTQPAIAQDEPPQPQAIPYYQPPSQFLNISAKTLTTWTHLGSSIAQLEGPVKIEVEHATLTADRAVVWIEPVTDGEPGEQLVTVSLLGNAQITQPGITRSGNELVATDHVNGPIKITADLKSNKDLSDSKIFQKAQILRLSAESASQLWYAGATTQPTPPPLTTQPTTGPTTRKINPVRISYPGGQLTSTNVEGQLAFVIDGGVSISTTQKNGEIIEMQAQRAVVFTTLTSLRGSGGMGQIHSVEEGVTSVYLEGDVRINIMPALASKADQRLQAERVYYDFTTDRAILTDAVIHTVDLQSNVPIIIRAKLIRQLSINEYKVEKAQLTTSSFAVPSYAIRADKAYIREEPTGDPLLGNRVYFDATGATFTVYNTPVFYLPAVAGVFTEHAEPLRGLGVGDSSTYGAYIKTEWGLFETLGKVPPQNIDISYTLDAFTLRGPAGGIDGKYGGGFISPTSKEPYMFSGDFKSYFVPNDTGEDVLGRKRSDVDPGNDFRGRVMWEHQNFFPQDWQMQFRTGWTSDATFREQWFEDEFNDGLPLETALYLKRQKDTEAITFLTTVQPNNVVTYADALQENFEVERLPQLGYRRIGDDIGNDQMTFYSQNTIERVRFNESGVNVGQEGFKVKRGVGPGIPSLGLVGVTGAAGPPIVPEDWNDRGDFRQEVDYPLEVWRFKVLPYVIGRYTAYSETPDGGRADRVIGATGVRVNTQFWEINNDVDSEFWDIHRTRHIIEPEVHLYTSAANVTPDDLFIYDEDVDKIYDVSAMQLALRQRWQTKRGGPGNWRTADFFDLNIEANFFANQPPDAQLPPIDFRGIFFPSRPELSTPRNSINADATWRISDTTLLLSDISYNMDQQNVATASIGMIAERGERTKYFASLRYIEELNSEVVTLAATYQLTAKYTLGGRIAYDFGNASDVFSSMSFERKFDRYSVLFTVYNDASTGESGFSFGFYPEGLGKGASTDALDRTFNGTR